MKGWRSIFAATDVPNNIDGGQCYAWAKVRPRWYWLYQRLHLFLGIAWRRYDEQSGRIDAATAWDVSKCANGLTRADLAKYGEKK